MRVVLGVNVGWRIAGFWVGRLTESMIFDVELAVSMTLVNDSKASLFFMVI
jgi:hypothetical protein